MNAETPIRRPEFQEVRACPLCNSLRDCWQLDAEALGAVPYDTMAFSIYRCAQCGIGITEPIPSENESHLLYEDRTSCDFQGDDSAVASALKRAIADRDIQKFVFAVPTAQNAPKMLDYACGNGAFSLAMRRVFPRSSIWATDYHVGRPPMFRDSDIQYSPYDNIGEYGPFDFILCRHVLEHTYGPTKFLQEMVSLLGVGGILMIEVPNVNAPLRKVFGRHWDNYYVPYHPIHFSAQALHRAVTEAGLVVVRTGGCEMPKIGRSLRNILRCEYNIALFSVGLLLQPIQFLARAATNEPTCLRLWARKP